MTDARPLPRSGSSKPIHVSTSLAELLERWTDANLPEPPTDGPSCPEETSR